RRIRWTRGTDGVQQRNTARAQLLLQLLEIAPEVASSHVLEHADAYDAIVLSVVGSIVLQTKLDAVSESTPRGFGARNAQLLRAQRQTHHGHANGFSEVQRESAPAATDVENLVTGLEQQLACDVIALRELGRLERHVAVAEIGAGVVHVAVEEGAEQLLVEIIVVMHVG